MKNYVSILLLIFLITGCNNGQLNSIKPNETPIIDGELTEWQGAMITPQNESFGFGVMNDDSNLYLSMSTYDQQAIMKVMNGLTIWIDDYGKKNQSFGIRYPIKQDMIDMQGMMGMGGMRSMAENREEQQEMMIQQRLSQQDGIIIVKNEIEQIADLDNGSDGIQGKMLYDNGDLIYELKIPLSEFSLDESNNISIGIETAKMEKPEMGGMRGGGGSEMPRGGRQSGGMSGGGNRGDRSGGGKSGGGRSSEAKSVTDKIESWIKIRLFEENK